MAKDQYREWEYVFQPGVRPSNTTLHTPWHGHARDGVTRRVVFQREVEGHLVWVIVWSFTPTHLLTPSSPPVVGSTVGTVGSTVGELQRG